MERGTAEPPADSGGPVRSIGIVTDDAHAELTDDGRAIASALGARGVAAEPLVWTDAVDVEGYDALLFRSCWDYHTDYGRFVSFLRRVERADIEAYNPPDVVRWNAHKSYLPALAEAGVRTTPTVWFEAGEEVSLEGVLRDRDWEEAVVKPAVGAGSEGVWRTSPGDAAGDQGRFEDDLSTRDTLVQRFVPEIEAGERSIVFVRGEYSHAWNDLPCGNDFSAFGERGVSYDPSDAVADEARAALAAACGIVGCDPFELPYARVDYLETDDGFVLMELELIEPNLELGNAPGAADRVAAALVELLG